MEIFPSIPIPSYSYILDSQFRTLVSDFESGTEQRRIMWRFPKRTVALNYKAQDFSSTGRDALYGFFQNRRGPGESFWYFDFQKRKIVDEFVGYGDGETATFDFHSKSTDNDATLKIYVAGVLKVITVDYDFVSGGGEGGSDRITFIAGHIPATGALITSDFNGYLRIKGRFKDDKLSEELFTINLENIQVTIFEIK